MVPSGISWWCLYIQQHAQHWRLPALTGPTSTWWKGLMHPSGLQVLQYQHEAFNHCLLTSVVLWRARGCGWGLLHHVFPWETLSYLQHCWVSCELFPQEEFWSPLWSGSPQQTFCQHLPQHKDPSACSAHVMLWALRLLPFLFENQQDTCKVSPSPSFYHLSRQRG